MDDEQVVKVMLNLSRDICDRCNFLTGWFAKNSLMRQALSLGLDILEKKQVMSEDGAA